MKSYIDNTKAREYSFKFFYQLEKKLLSESTFPSQETLIAMIEEYNNLYFEPDNEHPDNILSQKAKSFSLTLIKSASSNIKALLELINDKVTSKSTASLDKVCMPILLLGAAEIKYYKKTPKTVVINDYINIAKKYGTPEIASFINGVLDKVDKD